MGKPFSVDFGTADDWGTRVSNSWVKYGDSFAYVREVRNHVDPRDEDVLRELNNRLYETHEELVAINRERSALRYTLQANLYVYDGDNLSKPTQVMVNVEDLDLSYFKLGFVNVNTKKGQSLAAFVSRTPVRQYKHGMCFRNTIVQRIPECYTASREQVFKSTRLVPMFEDRYPTVEECLDQLFDMEGTNSLAFDREFAVRVDELGHTLLYHRNNRIGFLEQDNRFVLIRRFKYLTESLREKGVNFVT